MSDNSNPTSPSSSKVEIGSLSDISGGQTNIAGDDVFIIQGAPQPASGPQDIFLAYKNYILELRSKDSSLSAAPADAPIIEEIRICTLTTLRELEPERRGLVVNFLIDVELIKPVSLHRADLRKADLSMADLAGIDLSRANLRAADLRKADLQGANLSEADLGNCYLADCNLQSANLCKTDLRWANLSGANLRGADLREAKMNKAKLSDADLSGAIMPNGTKHK